MSKITPLRALRLASAACEGREKVATDGRPRKQAIEDFSSFRKMLQQDSLRRRLRLAAEFRDARCAGRVSAVEIF